MAAKARLPKNRSIVGPSHARQAMLAARWMIPTWRNMAVKSRQYSWSSATRSPSMAPQSTSDETSGFTAETPDLIIARKTPRQASTRIGVTKA